MVSTSARHRASRQAARTARTSAISTTTIGRTRPVDVVDEAFAGFEPPMQRPLEYSLVANLSAQLEALDQQREQLSRLLRSIDAASISQ